MKRHFILDEEICIVPYNPQWPSFFEEEKSKVQKVFGNSCAAIEHFGSTA